MNSVAYAADVVVAADDAERLPLLHRSMKEATWTYCSTGCDAERQHGATTGNPCPWRRSGEVDGGDANRNRQSDDEDLAQAWA